MLHANGVEAVAVPCMKGAMIAPPTPGERLCKRPAVPAVALTNDVGTQGEAVLNPGVAEDAEAAEDGVDARGHQQLLGLTAPLPVGLPAGTPSAGGSERLLAHLMLATLLRISCKSLLSLRGGRTTGEVIGGVVPVCPARTMAAEASCPPRPRATEIPSTGTEGSARDV